MNATEIKRKLFTVSAATFAGRMHFTGGFQLIRKKTKDDIDAENGLLKERRGFA